MGVGDGGGPGGRRRLDVAANVNSTLHGILGAGVSARTGGRGDDGIGVSGCSGGGGTGVGDGKGRAKVVRLSRRKLVRQMARARECGVKVNVAEVLVCTKLHGRGILGALVLGQWQV